MEMKRMNNSGRDIGLYIPPGYSWEVRWGNPKTVGSERSCLGRYATIAVGVDHDALEGITLVAQGSKIVPYKGIPYMENHRPVKIDTNPDSAFFAEHFPDKKFYRIDENYDSAFPF